MEELKIDKSETVCFTGHREIEPRKASELKVNLRRTIIKFYEDGFTNFLTGMALGFDMMAAKTVLDLKEECPEIVLICVVPFAGQDDRWSPSKRQEYEQILEEADQAITLSQRYYKGCEMTRNRFMLDHSDGVIAYYDGIRTGGTAFTYKAAVKSRRESVNLYK